jgi:hypothetical protein
VKRLLALAMVLSLGASVLVVSGAQSAFNGKAFVTKVTAKTTPKRDRRNPFVFTTKGKITPPTVFCTSTAAPTQSRNCVPLDCPAGATNTRYCVRPGLAVICKGKVNIRIQRRGRTISSRNVNLKANCTYSSKVTLRLKRNRRGSLKVRARFAGNTVLRVKASSTATVRAG